MALSPNIYEAMENNVEEFSRKVPVDEILNKLRFRHILSPAQVNKIKKNDFREDKNTQLYDIILSERNDEDFYKFCDLLKESNVTAVKKFADKLLSDAQDDRITCSSNTGSLPLDINAQPVSQTGGDAASCNSGSNLQTVSAYNSDLGMSQKDRNMLQSKHKTIINEIRSSIDPIVDELYSNSIITLHQKGDIKAGKTDYEKTDILLDILPHCGPKACDAFINAVETFTYPELAATLKKLRMG